MAYLGNDLQVAYSTYKNIDDISGSFNGSTTSFALLVGGVAPVPLPLNSQQCLISVGGVIQRPDDTGAEGFRLSGGNIVFSSAPSTGEDFFGVILAGADYVNVGANFPSGSAAVPSITFDSDLDTGIYNSAANNIAIATGGTQRLVVDSSGRLGLGTSSPTLQFEISNGANTGYLQPGIGIGLSVGTKNSSSLSLDTNNTTRVTITSGGLVGIGNTAPGNQNSAASQLVVGNTSANNGITILTGTSNDGVLNFNDGDNTSLRGYLIYEHSSDSLRFGSAGSERARIDSSGRLLVGTSSTVPDNTKGGFYSLLQVKGYLSTPTGDARVALTRGESSTSVTLDERLGTIYFTDNDGGTYAEIASMCDGTVGSSSDTPGRLVFSTTADGASSPTERMRITNTGRLSISSNGTVLSTAFLNVSESNNDFIASLQNTNASPAGLRIFFPTVINSTTNPFLYCHDNTNLRAEIRSNGGIANYSANNVNLSDINAKKDIAPASGTWDCLKEWEIVNFRYKDQPDDADLNMGVIAQQVAESCPEVITVFQEAKEATEDQPAQEERLGVKDQQMMWMAIKALQEAQLRIETLEAEVAALKGA